jgi:DMSO/TMAO reductase YedYZ heme-binding membrane subunit
MLQQSPAHHSFFRDWLLYFKAGLFGLFIFALSYGYLRWQNIPSELNKSVADTAIILMGCSMLLTSICYFWNFLDWSIVYRKYLGLIGFAFGLAHFLLSWGTFTNLLNISTWQQGKMWPALAGALALVIFSIMALVSNSFAARQLGVVTWKHILRTGYIAVIFVWVHVVLLKSARWITWFQGGMKTLPSLSLLVALFMTVVIVMRICLWWSLKRAASPAIKAR